MEVKDRIIISAYELFAAKGYEKTTIEEIIKQAECSKGGFYHHFKSKEDILEVIVSNYINDLSKYFEGIILNEKDSFINKFNEIFTFISQYKLKQLKEWSNINNIFIFAGNDRILRQLEKHFKIATTRTYTEVICDGIEKGIIKVDYPDILAELCTREILWIFEEAGKLVSSKDHKNVEKFEKLLEFSEDLIGHAMGMKKHEVRFSEAAHSYLQSIREYYFANREGL